MALVDDVSVLPRQVSVSHGPARVEPVKVARIIARLNVGGPARHCILLSEGLQRHGFETVLLTGALGARPGAERRATRRRAGGGRCSDPPDG